MPISTLGSISRRRFTPARAPHAGGRLRLRARFREQPRRLAPRRAERPRVPRLLHVLRLQPGRLQPPEDEGPRVPRRCCTGWRRSSPSLSDFYTVEYASFVETLRPPRDARAPCATPSSSRAERSASRTRSRPRSTGRCGATRRRGSPARRASRSSTSARPSTAARATRCRSPTPTRVKTDYFPKFDWPRIDNPSCASPSRRRSSATWRPPRSSALDEIERAFAENPDDIAAIIIEPIQAEGGDNHFRPEFLQALERHGARARRASSSSTRCRRASASRARCGPTSTSACSPTRSRSARRPRCAAAWSGPRVDEAPDNVFKVSSRINSTWGGNLTDMVRSARYLEIIDEDAWSRTRA